jgi:group I intron endonuclease
MGCVYLVRSPSGKGYVGITVDNTLKKRWGNHCRDTKNGSHLAFHTFVFQILEYSDDWSKLLSLEVWYIRELKTKAPLGYNLTDGGEGFVGLPPEVIKARAKKGGETRRGKPLSPSHRMNLSKAHKGLPSSMRGYKFTDVQRERMREAALRRWADPGKRQAALASTQSPETIKKRAQTLTGRKYSPEYCAAISAGQLKRFQDPAERLKLSLAQKARSRGGQ